MYHHPAETKWFWTQGLEDKAKAKNCIECGSCGSHCPQKIQIRDNLKLLQAELDALIN